jgi:hypothetical protein
VFDLDLHNKRKYIYQKKNKRKDYPFFFGTKKILSYIPTIILIPLQIIEAPINWRLGSIELLAHANERL